MEVSHFSLTAVNLFQMLTLQIRSGYHLDIESIIGTELINIWFSSEYNAPPNTAKFGLEDSGHFTTTRKRKGGGETALTYSHVSLFIT